MSIAGQRALARLFGLETATDAPPVDHAPTGREWMGGVPFPATDTPPPPEDDTPPDFDGGAREPAPAPDEPEKDHDELVKHLLAPREPDGQLGSADGGMTRVGRGLGRTRPDRRGGSL